MDISVSPVFLKNAESKKRITVNQGGTRSGKTWSILQVLIIQYALKRHGLIIDIVRKSQTELRDSVYVDFIEILQDMGIYQPRLHNKTKMTYRLNGNLFRFIGLDKSQKKRGSKRNILYVNEANGLSLEDWVQLNIRTTEKVFIDYNPSEYFWVNEHILEQDPEKFDLIISTYLDNYDFLEASQIKEIEDLILIDDFYYRVYVLGELAIMKGKIYNNYKEITEEEYDDIFHDEIIYGLDFGYEHKTCLVEIKIANEQIYEKCIYMESHKTDEDLIRHMDKIELDQNHDLYYDPAAASSGRKIRDAGYNAHKAKKDVKDGLRFCQSLKRNIVSSSKDAINNVRHKDYLKQNSRYKFKQTADGKIIEEPVKIDDDGPDAMRYGAFTHMRHLYDPLKVS